MDKSITHGTNKKQIKIGFLAEHDINEYQSQLMQGVFDAAKKYDVSVYRYAYNPYDEDVSKATHDMVKLIQLIGEQKLDGLLFIGWLYGISTFGMDHFLKLFESVQLLSLGSTFDKIPSVYMNGGEYIRELLVHLIEVHHYKKIVYISPYLNDDRTDEYIKVMKEYQLYDEKFMINASDLTSSGNRAKDVVSYLIERNLEYDVIVSLYLSEAVELIKELKVHGIKVPEDVAVTGYEDADMGKFMTPSITTIYFPWREMGFLGCENLVKILRKEEAPFSCATPSKLIIRNSCGCVTDFIQYSSAGQVRAKEQSIQTLSTAEQINICKEINRRFPYSEINSDEFLIAFLNCYSQKCVKIFNEFILSELNKVPDDYSVPEKLTDIAVLVSYLRKYMLPYVSRIEDIFYIEDVFYQAQALIKENTERIVGRWEVEAKKLNLNLNQIGTNLITAFDMQSMFSILSKSLAQINIAHCCIFLFEEGTLSFDECYLVFEFSHGKRVGVDDGECFLVKDAPKKIVGNNRLIIQQILYIKEEIMGVVLFEPGPMDERIYRVLGFQLSTAIWSTLMINKIKRTQGDLVKSEKLAALGGLVAGVAHEINTPIGVGISAMSYLESQVNDLIENFNGGTLKKSDFNGYLDSIQQSSTIVYKNLQKTAALVTNFKKISVDQTQEQKRLFKMREYTEAILHNIDSPVGVELFQIQLRCDPALQIISFPGPYSQIITNFIMNSFIHAFEKDTLITITLTLEKKEKKLSMIYSDNGKGIKAENLNKIYEPFFTTNRSVGAGLGLNIVHNIVTQIFGGTIVCKSKLGEGTTFTIEFEVEE